MSPDPLLLFPLKCPVQGLPPSQSLAPLVESCRPVLSQALGWGCGGLGFYRNGVGDCPSWLLKIIFAPPSGCWLGDGRGARLSSWNYASL